MKPNGDAAAVFSVFAAGANEKEAGDAGFASGFASCAGGVALLPAVWKENGEGEAAAGAGLPEKLKVGFAGSATFVSASARGVGWSCFLSAASSFDAPSALSAGVPVGRLVEVGAGAGALALLLPNEKGWLPKVAPALKPGLSELNAGWGGGGDVALAAAASLLASPVEAAEGSKEKGFEAASLLGVCTAVSTPESGVAVPSFLSEGAAGFASDCVDSAESLLPNMPPSPPNVKLPASALPLDADSSGLPFASLSSAALLAAKAENDPCPKPDPGEPNADAGDVVGF